MVRRLSKLAVSLLLLAQSCDHEDEAVAKHCEALCDVANRCGLVPSPLGTTVKSCIDRCSLTDVAGEGGVRDSIMSCLPDGGLGAGNGPDWCSSRFVETTGDAGMDAGAASDSQCESMARCLDELWPARVTGDAIVAIGVVQDDGASCSELDVARDASTSTFDELRQRCDEFGQPQVTLMLRDRVQVHTSNPLPCAAAVTNGVVFSGVAPGWVVAGMRIEGTRMELDAGSPETSMEGIESPESAAITGLVCVTRWDDATNVVAAGKNQRVAIAFPESAGLVSDCLGICAALPACQTPAPPSPPTMDAGDLGDGAMPDDSDGGD